MTESVENPQAGFYVDVHAHVFPDSYAEALQEARINDVDGWKNPVWSVESALKAMDSNNIRTQALRCRLQALAF